MEPMRESLFTRASSPKVLLLTSPLDYDNIISQIAQFVNAFGRKMLHKLLAFFGAKFVQSDYCAKIGSWRPTTSRQKERPEGDLPSGSVFRLDALNRTFFARPL